LSEGATELLKIRARDNGVSLSLNYADGLPEWFVGDPVRVQQIITNYLSNAIKFTKKGSVILKVEGAGRLLDGRMTLRILVKDTGVGVPKDVQATLFQKFTQADSSTTRKYGGTGLGLAICRQIAQMMGGEVGLESEEGHGSTFWFTVSLPETQQQSSNHPSSSIDAARPRVENFAGIRVLVGEDDPTNQELVTEILNSFACKVTAASTGREVIEQARSSPFDIILMDGEMPEMSGFEASVALSMMKAEGQIPDIPIVALTAHAMKGDRERCLEAGMCDHLTKPVRKRQLAETLARWTEKKTDRRQYIAHNALLEGRSILLVDDTFTNRELAESILVGFGCIVTNAENGQEAVDILTHRDDFDLILMDCAMPVMDGYEASRRICSMKNSGRLPSIPIIALTAHAMKGDREHCLEAGMDDYLTKPVRKQALYDAVALWIEKKGSGSKVINLPVEEKDMADILDMEMVEEARDALGDRYPHSVRRFLEEGGKRIERIRTEILSGGSWEKIAFDAHSFKSSAACLGAAQLPQHAAELDMAARKLKDGGDIGELAPLLEELSTAFDLLADAMQKEISASS